MGLSVRSWDVPPLLLSRYDTPLLSGRRDISPGVGSLLKKKYSPGASALLFARFLVSRRPDDCDETKGAIATRTDRG